MVSMAHWAFVFGLCVAFCGRNCFFLSHSPQGVAHLRHTHTRTDTHRQAGRQMCAFLLPGLLDYDLIPGKGSEKKNQLTSSFVYPEGYRHWRASREGGC